MHIRIYLKDKSTKDVTGIYQITFHEGRYHFALWSGPDFSIDAGAIATIHIR
jgi:hypothetical protein